MFVDNTPGGYGVNQDTITIETNSLDSHQNTGMYRRKGTRSRRNGSKGPHSAEAEWGLRGGARRRPTLPPFGWPLWFSKSRSERRLHHWRVVLSIPCHQDDCSATSWCVLQCNLCIIDGVSGCWVYHTNMDDIARTESG